MLFHNYGAINKKDKTYRYKYLRRECFLAVLEIGGNCQLFIETKTRRFFTANLHSTLPLIKNRCLFTNNCNSVIRSVKISRHKFRNAAGLGYLTGVFKM
jgi:ribosomal protein S14